MFAHGADGGSRGLCCVLVLGGGGGGDGGGDGGGGEQRCDHDHETARRAAPETVYECEVRFCSMLKRTMKSRATSDGARRVMLHVLSSRLQSARSEGVR